MERNLYYVVRHGEVEQVWQHKVVEHGFTMALYVRGTESEVRAYLDSEYPDRGGRYHALTESEIEMVGQLGIPVYIAPRL